jgi:hypothetical protein
MEKITTIAAKYRHAFSMLCVLDPDGSEWSSKFQELGKQDVRCFAEAELPEAPTEERMQELHERTLLNGGVESEGNRTVSWIWRGSLKDGSEQLGEGMSLVFYSALFSDLGREQSFVSSGRRHMHESPGGMRRLNCSRRK